jgi:structural maintenance of chromosome 1
MDAISFVLGVKAAHLRGVSAADLVYHDEGRAAGARVRCYVKMVLKTEDGEQIHFQRSITPNGQTEYRVDNQTVLAADYTARLSEHNILVRARNCLVFQVRPPISCLLSYENSLRESGKGGQTRTATAYFAPFCPFA